MTKYTHLDVVEATLLDVVEASRLEDSTADMKELTFDEIAELVEEATMLRWSSRPTTPSGRCC